MNDYVSALIGGVLIGIATVGYLYSTGRIVGISGMMATLPKTKASAALFFLIGIALAAALMSRAFGLVDLGEIRLTAPAWLLGVAGIFVGVGTRLGSGCTSGHGICGMARMSRRSMAATATFLLTGILTVAMMRYFRG
ncbi:MULTISPECIES: YeeE/YedE family protein [Moraxella]|uniref:Putative transmembrane protein n=1 Tax=Moraxella catarrhalis TaxID=480 RepID=A0A7Z0UYY2_MORCA|nr:YeeE/YedE thiosulfate transporter family protein [Moraxella catarrhalis]OAV01129.1 putative transmembrane protein [Moraxella catarrhalis]STY81602.1 Predicted transporter component [Moraxella catarrhalis]